MVGRYLERYVETYPGADIRLNTQVVKTEKREGGGTWDVTVKDVNGQSQEETLHFDYLIVASGFFGTPCIPAGLASTPPVPCIHSTQYRDLNTLLGTLAPRSGTIAVIGGQLSGVELAATIALHISTMKNLPGSTPVPTNLSVTHVSSKPTWIFPLHIPADPAGTSAPRFLPMDIALGNAGRRAKPLVNLAGHVSKEAAEKTAEDYQGFLGDQGSAHVALKVPTEARKDPAHLGISQLYTQFVRAGDIMLTRGRFASVADTTITLTSGATIPNVAAIVFATGFIPNDGLSMLPASLLPTFSHSASNPRIPVALALYGTHHPEIPTLGFVGFYRSPYWSIMEMQSRVLAALWSPQGPPPSLTAALAADTSISSTQALRNDPRCSQFPMGDAMFLNSFYAVALGLTAQEPYGGGLPPLPSGTPVELTIPTQYLSPLASPTAIQQNTRARAQAYADTRDALNGTRNLAAAVFRSLLGKWRLERSLVSRRPSYPSGHYSGIATFSVRAGTMHGLKDDIPDVEDGESSEGETDLVIGDVRRRRRHWSTRENRLDFITEYVYNETGTFTADNGLKFQASRNYIWRYDEVDDVLSVWFASVKDIMEVDYLFHNIKFEEPETDDEGRHGRKWKASAGHLCVKDFYNVSYEFEFKGVELDNWQIAYGVKGPDKDYRLEGSYTRL